jgi:acyl phosphate:glycerol-3-phosphate acyltransferase
MLATIILVVSISYLLGSIPVGYLLGRSAGIDIRKSGSGNIGATNVLRVLGKKYGYPVFFLDAFKGFAAVRTALWIASASPVAISYTDYLALTAAVICVVGHAFPIWLKFKGGKGVATSAGVIIGLMPLAAIIVFPIWFIVFYSSRYVSVASGCAALSLPLTIAVFLKLGITHNVLLLYFTVLMALVVIWRHRSNFSRLLHGTEPRFHRK